MNLLAIDTSTSRASVALAINQVIYSETAEHVKEHAQSLLPMIERLLQKHAVSLAQLDGIAFGQGPGSFTGLRIACSIAKGLAYAHDLPLYPVSGLASIAYQLHHVEKSVPREIPVLAMIDARMNQVYWGVFSANASTATEHVSAMSDIPMQQHAPFVAAGVNFEPYWASLTPAMQVCASGQKVVYPDALAFIALVQAGLIQPVSADKAEPVYIRNHVTQGGGG